MGIRWGSRNEHTIVSMSWEAEVAFWRETIEWLERHPEIHTQKSKLREARYALKRVQRETRRAR